jgi:hypothetical protein
MMLRTKQNRKNALEPATPLKYSGKLARSGVVVCIVLLAALATTWQLSSQQTPRFDKPILLPEANRPPDANAQMAMHEQNAKKADFNAANLERKRQIADDSAKLLKLASDLKSEVDKTSKDTLSLGVIRKAEEIEKLAHNVKEKMKLTMGGS